VRGGRQGGDEQQDGNAERGTELRSSIDDPDAIARSAAAAGAANVLAGTALPR
jgi:hypothetical protein